MSDAPVVETVELTKVYGDFTALDHLSIRLEKGQILGFIGPNGAGKTTTIKMLLGLVKPTKGSVQIFGEDIAENRKEILRKTGSLVESPTYYGHLSGYDNLQMIARILGLSDQKVEEVLQLVRLSDAADQPVKSYSLGMKQRLGIAAALIGDPQHLILDEPTNGLDPAGIREIRELITRLPCDSTLSK